MIFDEITHYKIILIENNRIVFIFSKFEYLYKKKSKKCFL